MLGLLLSDLKNEEIYASEITNDEIFFDSASVPGWLQVAFLRVAACFFLRSVAEKAKASKECVNGMQKMSPGLLESAQGMSWV